MTNKSQHSVTDDSAFEDVALAAMSAAGKIRWGQLILLAVLVGLAVQVGSTMYKYEIVLNFGDDVGIGLLCAALIGMIVSKVALK